MHTHLYLDSLPTLLCSLWREHSMKPTHRNRYGQAKTNPEWTHTYRERQLGTVLIRLHTHAHTHSLKVLTDSDSLCNSLPASSQSSSRPSCSLTSKWGLSSGAIVTPATSNWQCTNNQIRLISQSMTMRNNILTLCDCGTWLLCHWGPICIFQFSWNNGSNLEG